MKQSWVFSGKFLLLNLVRASAAIALAIVFVLAFVFASIASASEARRQPVSVFERECREITSRQRCEDTELLGADNVRSQLLKLQIKFCEDDRAKRGCDDLYKKESTPPEARIGCDAYSVCVEHKVRELKKSRAWGCAVGAGNFLEDTYDGVVEGAKNAWAGILNDSASRKKLIADGEANIETKREFIADIPNFASLRDKQLSRYSMEQLIDIRRQVDRTRESVGYATPVMKLASGPSELDEYRREQYQERLKEAYRLGEEWVEQQGLRLACYNSEAAWELGCYGASHVVDPLAAAGLTFKAVKAAKIIERLKARHASAEVKGDRRHASSEDSSIDPALTRTKVTGDRAKFVSTYLHRDPTTEAQNEAWIAVARRSLEGRQDFFFFDVENSLLKYLNDTLHDKDLVTGMNNLYKEIFEREMAALKKKFPGKIQSYSDYKSLRYAFDGKPPVGFEKEMQAIYKRTNGEFTERVKQMKLLREEDPDPRTWFKSGMMDETADEATLTSRYARRDGLGAPTRRFDDLEVQQYFTKAREEANVLREGLETALGKTGLMEKAPGADKLVLSRDTWDVLRKARSPEELASKIKSQFKSDLSPEVVQQLREYASRVEDFSPGLHIAKRDIASLDEAVHGGFSADFKGLGADNAMATELGVVMSKNVKDAIVKARHGEMIVTQEFLQRKKGFQNTVTDVLKKRGIDVSTVCSGDDCVVIPGNALTLADKDAVIAALAEKKNLSQTRISFIPNKLPADIRSKIGVHGETIEKYLDMDLRGKIPRENLKQVLFGIDMDVKGVGDGRVHLIIGGGRNAGLSREQEALIRQSFMKALDTINRDLAKQGLPAAYKTGGIR